MSRSALGAGLPGKANDLALLLEDFLDVIPNCLIAINKSGEIVHINNTYCELLGLQKKDIIGRHVTSIVSPETQLHLVARGAPPTRNQTLVVRGHKMLVNQVPIRNGDEVIGAVGIALFTEADQILGVARRLFSIDIRNQARPRLWPSKYSVKDIIGDSDAIQGVRECALRAARTRATVLIVGESGTGKELIAHSIHAASSRAERPFVHVNCAAIPRSLLETELFGYEGGSFTGARARGHPGKFELANGGTIFLDEIGDMPMEMQSALLRILQERELVRVGGTQPLLVDVRVICATHRDLHREVREGRFRQDLFYRIDVFRIDVPPLRERLEDVAALTAHILDGLCDEYEIDDVSAAPDTIDRLARYRWPGNVRELRNALEHALHRFDGGVLRAQHLPTLLDEKDESRVTGDSFHAVMSFAERAALQDALERARGNKSKAASILGIDRTSLYKKLRAHNLI